MINQKTRLFISFIFILLCINTYTGTYNIYHEQLDTNTDYKIVSTGFYYNDNSFLNKNNFSEPYNLMIKTNLFYMNPEILYPEYIIFTDYEKSNNYPIMELWENTEYRVHL